MAQCDTEVLMADAGCFSCVKENERHLLKLVLLQRIAANTDDVDTLMAKAVASGFHRLNREQRQAIRLQMLCETAF